MSMTSSRSPTPWWLLPCLAFAACADESKTNHETDAATQAASHSEQTSEATQSPTNIEPTTLMLAFEGAEQDGALMSPASARLDLDVDGMVVFSAYAMVSDEAFSLRLAISHNAERLQGQMFKLEPGVEQPNQISLIQGAPPSATAWRSVDGTAQFESFGQESFELTFDVQLSRDPRSRGATTKATGSFRGGALFVCQGLAVSSPQGDAQSSNGQGRSITSVREQECRARLAKLVPE